MRRGFTLLELLIVIAIIGVLASIVLASTSTARKRGQYAFATQQIEEIGKALQLFAAAKLQVWPNVFYPHSGSTNIGHCYHVQYLIDPTTPGACGFGRGAQVAADFNMFNQFLPAWPPDALPYLFYAYYNEDIPVEPSCSTGNSPYAGVGIRIGVRGGAPTNTLNELIALYTYFDQLVDNGDGKLCGRVRFDDLGTAPLNNLLYIIAESRTDL